MKYWKSIGGIGVLLLLELFGARQLFDVLVNHYEYLAPFMLGLNGLILLSWWAQGGSNGYFGGSLICIIAAHWMNPSIAFALAPMVLLHGELSNPCPIGVAVQSADSPRPRGWNWLADYCRSRSKEQRYGVANVLIGFLSSVLLSRLCPYQNPYGINSPIEWLRCSGGHDR